MLRVREMQSRTVNNAEQGQCNDGMPAVLWQFFEVIKNDPRISSTHISVFATLLYFRMLYKFVNPIEVFSAEIMQMAKISSPNTYRKCLRDMTEYGYLTYVPSFKKNQASKIYFNDGG